MRNVIARCVPHYLAEEQRQHNVEIAKPLLSRFESEVESFLKGVVAIDLIWIRSYRARVIKTVIRMEYPASLRPTKFRRKQCHLKMTVIYAYDTKGILVSHRVPSDQTVNQEYFIQCIMKHLRQAIRKKAYLLN